MTLLFLRVVASQFGSSPGGLQQNTTRMLSQSPLKASTNDAGKREQDVKRRYLVAARNLGSRHREADPSHAPPLTQWTGVVNGEAVLRDPA